MDKMYEKNKMSTSKAASISVFITIILFISTLVIAQMVLPIYLYQTSSYYTIAIFLTLIPLGIGVLIYLILTKQRISDVIIFSKPQAKMNRKNMPWLIALAAAMAVVGRSFITGIQLVWLEILESVGFKALGASLPAIDNFGVFIAALLAIAVTPAIFEELVFRGILQKGLLRNTKPKTAIIISSVLFSMMHLSVENLPFTFLLGCLMGYMAYRCGSIVPSMVFHLVNNGVAVVGLYYLEIINMLYTDIPDTTDLNGATTIVLAIAAIISLILLSVAIWGFKKLSKSPPENPYLRTMKPVSIVMLVLSACVLLFVLAVLAIMQNVVLM